MLLVYRSSLKCGFIRCVAQILHCCSVWIVHFEDQCPLNLYLKLMSLFFAPCVIFHRSVAEAHVEKHGVMFKKVYRRYENCQWRSPSWALRTMSKPFTFNEQLTVSHLFFFSCKMCSSHGYVEYNHMTVTIKFTWERHDFKLIWMLNLYVGNLFCKWSTA